VRALIRRSIALLVPLVLLSTTLPRIAIAEDVLRATLKNGLRVVIVPNRLAPVASTEINYLVGSNEAPPGFPGTAHALEHMMFRGSPGLSADQLAYIMAAMGGEFNADTQQTVTQYFFTVPAENLDTALQIEAVRMREVLASQPLWEKERGAIEQEVAQDLSNPMYLFFIRLLKQMYAGTPYAHSGLGTVPSFDATTAAMLKEFHATWYTPNNAILIVTGDVDPPKTLATVTRLFKDIPSRPLPARPEATPQPLAPTRIEMQTDLPYGLAVVAFRLPGYDSPDFAAAQVLADVLDSERGDLLGLVPAGKALAAGFDIDPCQPAAIGLVTATFPQGDDGSAMVAQLKEIIAGYLKKGMPVDLVSAAKRREVAAAEFRKNSIPGLAALWSQALAVEGRRSPEEDIEAITKVTVADVNRVARQYLDNNTAVTAVLTPRSGGKPMTAGTFGGKESFAPREVQSVSLPAWARGIVRAEIPPPMIAPADQSLTNGLRLIVQTTDVSPTVSLYGQIKSNPDLQVPPGKEGVDMVLDELFSYGTTSLDRLAFQQALDEIAADVSAGTSFSLQVPVDQLDRGMQLLADNLLHPGLPAAAFTVVRQETAASLAGRLTSPDYLARRTLKEAVLPKNDPALRQATPQTVGNLSLADVRDYYRRVFRPDITTIVVIGMITPERTRALIEKYFGNWRAIGPKPDTDLPPVPANRPSVHVVPDPGRVQDAVLLSQTVGITRHSPDYYPLRLGEHILSGAFYATRLSRDLREETGLVYTVEGVLHAGKTRSSYTVYYGCDPQNVAKARAIIVRDLRALQTVPVTEVELQQAKTLLIRHIPLARQSVDAMADQWLSLVQDDLPLDEPHRAAQRYRETTAALIREAFGRWIRPDDFVQVTLGPAPR
jgi:zinc protease